MLSWTQLLAFLIPTLALNVTPGPDMLYVFGHAMKSGQKAARSAAFGVWVGYLVHVLLVSLGVATLLQTYPPAFKAVKIIGAAYLLWIGGSTLRAKESDKVQQIQDSDFGTKLFKQGFFVSALNPKVAVFFLAYLPQFVDSGTQNPTLQFAILGLIFSLSATVANLTAGYFASSINERFFKQQLGPVLLNRICGVVLILLAAKLVL